MGKLLMPYNGGTLVELDQEFPFSAIDEELGYQGNIMNNHEQVMEMFAEAERALMNDTQPSTQQEDLLLQDCMWNGGYMYASISIGVGGCS